MRTIRGSARPRVSDTRQPCLHVLGRHMPCSPGLDLPALTQVSPDGHRRPGLDGEPQLVRSLCVSPGAIAWRRETGAKFGKPDERGQCRRRRARSAGPRRRLPRRQRAAGERLTTCCRNHRRSRNGGRAEWPRRRHRPRRMVARVRRQKRDRAGSMSERRLSCDGLSMREIHSRPDRHAHLTS